MCAECDAQSIMTRRTPIPSASHRAWNSSTASTSPDTPTDRQPFTAATDSRSPYGSISSRTSSSTSGSATIPPLPAIASIARLRNATIRAPSSSDRPPTTHAAAISPCE